jgi:hypothetical protein
MAALGLSACTASTASSRQSTAADQLADERAESGLRERHQHQHHGGAMQFIVMGLDTLGPNDASRPKVEQLQRDLEVCLAPAGEIQRQLELSIADGVAAGSVDLAQADGLIRQLDGASLQAHACSGDALNQLHALLSPAERAELVEKVQAHWEVWREVNDEGAAASRGAGGRLGRLARELRLTPEQVERASASLHVALTGRGGTFDRARVDASLQAFAAAFVSESFDARTVSMQENGRLASFGASRRALFYETITPLLTAGQRAELAGHLRQRAGSPLAASTN